MSGDDSKDAAPSRRLLAKVQHSVSPAIFCLVLRHMEGKKDVIDPLVVQSCSSPRVTFTMAFDMLGQNQDQRCVLRVVVRNVEPPNMKLLLEVAGTRFKRPFNADVSSETDKSKWPAAERLIRTAKISANKEGRVCSCDYRVTRALTIDLEVYAVCNAEGDGQFSGDVLGNLNALRLRETLADVELRVDGEVFPAHRNVLAANSPVFHGMFTSDLKEAQEGVVEIQGASSAAFGLFLEFLYTASLGDWKGCELELLELSDRYMVDHLKAVCEERLLSLPRRALAVLQHAEKPVISSDLRAKAVRVVVRNWSALSETQEWQDFEATNPVAAESMRVAPEVYLPPAKQS